MIQAQGRLVEEQEVGRALRQHRVIRGGEIHQSFLFPGGALVGEFEELVVGRDGGVGGRPDFEGELRAGGIVDVQIDGADRVSFDVRAGGER